MKKVLLCPPTHFALEYQINPWMDLTKKIDRQKAFDEYNLLKQTYIDLGCEVLEIEQGKELPDMVFAANCGFPVKKTFIKANFKYKERKKEAELAKKYFEKLGFTIRELPKHISFEGQGDLFTIGGKYFLGWGKRTDFEAKKYLEDILETKIIDFKMVDPYYYHLDTCFLPLDRDTVAINPYSFEKEGLEILKKHFKHIIRVGKEDNNILACNGVVVDKTIVISRGISKSLKDDFQKAGFTTKEVSTEEFLKSGGSVKCLTLEFF